MPNIKGGKAYKKTKHSTNEIAAFVEPEKDQLYGRIVRNMGANNMMVFCNDGKERICHICGKMRRRVWLNIGDIVIVSLRELMTGQDDKERGDILSKCDASHYARIRKEVQINSKLFLNLETLNASQRTGIPDSMDEGYIMESEENAVGDNLQLEEPMSTSISLQKSSSAMVIHADNSVDIDTI